MGNATGGQDNLDGAPQAAAAVDHALFDACGFPLAQVDVTGAVISFNRPMRALLDELGHQSLATVRDFVPAESAPMIEDAVRVAMRSAASDVDAELRGTDGRSIEARLRISPYPADKPRHALIAAIPLEPFREAARDADRRRSEARRFESLGMLAGGIAHDFNNLLVGIVGGAALAASDIPADSIARKHLRLIDETAQRIAVLTQQMLAFSGQGHITMEKLNLSQVITEQRESLDELAAKRGCRVSLALADGLPYVQGDRFQMRKVLAELVSNACEAMQGSGGEVEIRTRVVAMRQRELTTLLPPEPRSEGEYVLVEVRDQGPGVSAPHREKVFDPFFTTHEAGRGLGLAAALGIVRGHRGFVAVDSSAQGGAMFRVGFPARSEGRLSTILEESTADEVTPGTGIVLVVDDEDMVRHVAALVLRRSGYEVIEARDGIEAIELIDENAARVSLVLLDLSMPRMGGREALEEIRARHPNLPVMLMSGYPEAEACNGFRRRDLAGFIQKPFRAEILREAIGGIIPPTRSPTHRDTSPRS